MPNLEDFLPPLPHQGPPLPSRLGVTWPVTPEEVQRAVKEYALSADRAINTYRRGWERSIEHYRASLLGRL